MTIPLTKAGNTPQVPAVLYRWPNGAELTPTEHAIATARKWQLRHMPPDGIPSEAYTVVVGLLSTFSPTILEMVYKAAGLTEATDNLIRSAAESLGWGGADTGE